MKSSLGTETEYEMSQEEGKRGCFMAKVFFLLIYFCLFLLISFCFNYYYYFFLWNWSLFLILVPTTAEIFDCGKISSMCKV